MHVCVCVCVCVCVHEENRSGMKQVLVYLRYILSYVSERQLFQKED